MMIKDEYVLKSSPIFLLSPGENVGMDLALDKTPLVPVKDKSLVIKVIRKKKKVIVKGKIEVNATIEIKLGKSLMKVVANSKGYFKIELKTHKKNEKLKVTLDLV